MKKLAIVALVALPITTLAASGRTQAVNACGSGERWSFGPSIPAESRALFAQSFAEKASPAESYANGIALQRSAPSAEGRAFGGYWSGRALLQAKLPHLAFEAFARLAGQSPSPETSGAQIAALECINRINDEIPSLGYPVAPDSLTAVAPSSDPEKHVLAEYALNWVKSHPAEKTGAAFAMLKGTGAYEALAKGLVASAQENHPATIAALEAFLGQAPTAPSVPRALRKHLNHARLLLARAHFASGHYELAALRYRQIDKSSNQLTTMLSELAWSYLQGDRYGDAVGASTQLQAGNLRSTFVPEAPMISAMALNELCQFQDSLRTLQKLNHDYRDSFFWLNRWASRKSDRADLYPIAIQFLQHKLPADALPARIGTEWTRSTAFIAKQDEINRLFAEKAVAARFAEAIAGRQTELAERIRDLAEGLDLEVSEQAGTLKATVPKGAKLEDSEELHQLRQALATHHHLQAALPEWQRTLASFDASVGPRQEKLASEISQDLDARSMKMLAQLHEVAENSRMIKVEIYNGASHDMIWQNANPDYKDVAKELAEEMRDQEKRPASQVWDWGTVKSNSAKIEIWEDELGSFKAQVADNCTNKNKYLALRKK